MQIIVNGVSVPAGDRLTIDVTADAAGERLPPLEITGHGGHVEIHRSDLHTGGTVQFHVFGEAAPDESWRRYWVQEMAPARWQTIGTYVSAEQADEIIRVMHHLKPDSIFRKVPISP